MWDVLKAALGGGAAVFCTYAIVMILLRGCVAVVGAHEPLEPIEAQGVYEVWGIRGKPIIDPKIYDQQDPIVIVIEHEPIEVVDSGINYVECNRNQKFNTYVIKRLRARTDTPPGFWDETIKMYEDLIKECNL